MPKDDQMTPFEEVEEFDEGNTYPQAGQYAPPEVQDAIEEFLALPASERAKQPLLYWLLGDSTQPYKMSKADSQYTDKSPYGPSQLCSNCAFAYFRVFDEAYICSQIRGVIKPEGWCRLWEPTQ